MPAPHRLDAAAVRDLTDDITALRRACYSGPPWYETPEQIAGYPAKLHAATTRPGFVAHAVHGPADELAGICYGWPSPPDLSGDHIYDALQRALGSDGASALTRGAFEVVQLFVHPDAQNRGHGRRLLAAATSGWPSAWLITHPGSPAAALYRRLGWHEHVTLPSDLHPRLTLAVFNRTIT